MEGKISALKKKYWGDKTVILHSRDIRKCDKEFKILFDLDTKRCFYEDIDALLGEKDAYSVVSCSILKEPYIRQFGKFNDIYGQSLSFLIERSIFYLDDVSDNADMHIIAEMRGKQQDQSLLNYYNRLRDVGTHWVTPERLQSHIRKFDFLSKWKIRTKLTPEIRSKLTPCFSFNSRQESRNFRAEPSRFAA